MRFSSVVILVTVIVANLALWAAFNRPQPEVAWTGTINGASFSPFRAGGDPLAERFPTAQQIDEDLKLLSTKVRKEHSKTTTDGGGRGPRRARGGGRAGAAGAGRGGGGAGGARGSD